VIYVEGSVVEGGVEVVGFTVADFGTILPKVMYLVVGGS